MFRNNDIELAQKLEAIFLNFHDVLHQLFEKILVQEILHFGNHLVTDILDIFREKNVVFLNLILI